MNIGYIGLKVIFKTYHTILPQNGKVVGAENLPPGAKILAGNHPNATDAFHLLRILKDRIYFIVQRDLYYIPIFGWCLWLSRQIPVHLKKKHLAILRACEELAEGHTVMIFPEGKLNPKYENFKASTGAVRMSLMTGAPIIPVGTYMPAENLFTFNLKLPGGVRRGQWQDKGTCYFHIGLPWYPASEFSDNVERAPLVQLTDMMMEKIRVQVELARQDYLADVAQRAPVLAGVKPALPASDGD